MSTITVRRNVDDTATHARDELGTFIRILPHALAAPVSEAIGHHLEALGSNGVDDLGALSGIGDLELLLKEDGCLLVG